MDKHTELFILWCYPMLNGAFNYITALYCANLLWRRIILPISLFVCLFVCLLWHASGGLGTWTNVDNLRPGRSDLLWGLSSS